MSRIKPRRAPVVRAVFDPVVQAERQALMERCRVVTAWTRAYVSEAWRQCAAEGRNGCGGEQFLAARQTLIAAGYEPPPPEWLKQFGQPAI